MFSGQVAIEHCIDTGSNSVVVYLYMYIVHVDALLTSVSGIWLL